MYFKRLMSGFGLAAVALGGGLFGFAKPEKAVTFTKDVAPILLKNCAACHRPSDLAP